MPTGITATTSDYVNLGNGWNTFTAAQLSNGGQTITITGINASPNDLAFELQGKTIPPAGTYTISEHADADGAGTAYAPDSQSVTLVSQ